MSRLKILVFNKKRRLQLDAFKRSLKLHSGLVPIVYSKDCKGDVGQFKRDVLEIIDGSEYVMFCVDDTIFIRDFDAKKICHLLDIHQQAIGFSLRLGRNTTYCYMHDCKQVVPQFSEVQYGCLKYNWKWAKEDFAYPLEISSSVYRRNDIVKILNKVDFNNPTTLEMALNRSRFLLGKSFLLCFPQSVAVSIPWNKVQTHSPNNRCGYHTEEELDELYEVGKRMDVSAYENAFPNAVHEELILRLEGE